MKTTFSVSARPEAWAALADPERLAAALPGCRSVTRAADGHGTLRVVTEVAMASVRGLWAGTVAAVDADAVRVAGSGAPGAVDLVVRADPERTTLTVEGTVDGALGTVGSAVFAAAVRRMAEDVLAATESPMLPVTDLVGAQPDPSPAPLRRAGRGRAVAVAAAVTAVVAAIAAGSRRRRAHRGAS